MEVVFSPFIPINFQPHGDLFCLVFSSEIKSINGKMLNSGLFEGKISNFKKEINFSLRTKNPFQFLIITTHKDSSWASNIYFTGTEFIQAPWISASIKQDGAFFSIFTKVEEKEHEKTMLTIQSEELLEFATPHTIMQEDEAGFSPIPSEIKGFLASEDEVDLLLTVENEYGFATSLTLQLNKKTETSIYPSVFEFKDFLKNKTASFLVVKDVPQNVCVFGAENSFNKKAVVPKKNFETAKIYNFTNEERELEIELNYA